jgi:2-polyprenyl-6-methoxyphenol hydroxylase-like FAD-dependent oxidoreductase
MVLIGDAAGKNDPSQGHGLSLVFHDVVTLSGMLAGLPWREVPDAFHAHRAEVFETLRQHAHWNERQATETGPEIDALRERIRLSREADPTAAGFAGIFATGPLGLRATEEARRVFLGEDVLTNS